MGEYAISYKQGREAGREYPFPAEWRSLFIDGRSVTGHGTMDPSAVAGWMRGFRHGCMEQAS